ncbi:MAG: hypothetical protein R3266_08270, partial [Gemmatimonadota bacterium]|nr:hypothetical protein [Gemmatimonadota bacterium]
AARLGARSVPTPGLARADSLWARATDAADGGRHAAAAEAFASAREAYGEAGREARQSLVERMDSARAGTDSLRQLASPEHEAYAEAERHRAESRDLEVAGDRLGALAALDRASRAYVRAMPFVELPADYEAEPDPAEAPEASPAERIESAMSALERAFEAEDVDAIQRVWVNLSPGQVEGFRGFFTESGDVDYQYALDPASVRVTDQGIEFEVAVRWEYEERGEVHTQSFDQRFRLEPTGSGDALFSL